MGFSKKVGKGRLDKYYFLAKDQGYRARSAFKLIQLNKKYNFLEKARVLVDLCAAPGGWLQVAAKYMPVSQLIIGIDLAPIKPIPNVITLIDDITTEKCRSDLKRELKSWKADVFLNDGAPNVGSSWLHDAFTQAELVLSALKLATEFLNEGGTFVTKVFRSKDYNSLLWVFKQLFKTVEATKPASSRNVSAEIFVVCRGFLAPSSIDPRFLDAKYVFEEVKAAGAEASGSTLNILKPEKKQRHREGYADGQMILHRVVPVSEFISSKDPVGLLSTVNELSFGPGEGDALHASEDIVLACRDLKVLGRKDFKALLKWRTAQREALKEPSDEEKEEVKEGEIVHDPLKELDDLTELKKRMVKREKRKELEKKAKQRLRLQLQMEHGADLADDMHEEGLFNIRALKRKAKLAAVVDNSGDEHSEHELSEDDASEDSEGHDESHDELLDSADEAARWDAEMEESYARFQAERLQKDALRYVKKQHEEDNSEASLHGSGEDDVEVSHSSSSDGEDDAGLNVDIRTAAEKRAQLEARASRFYASNESLFTSILGKAKGLSKRASKEEEADEEPEDLPASSTKKQKKQQKNKGKEKGEEGESKGIVFVKAETFAEDEEDDEEGGEKPYDEEHMKRLLMTDPRAMSLATSLVSDKRRNRDDLVDKSFNRYAFGDSALLPAWFRDDEAKHNRPQEPISKEAAALIKERMRKLEAQPSRKVLEAKGRNKMRAVKRLETLKRKAAVIADSEEIGGRQKSEQIEKIMRSGKKTTKKEKKVVVAKGKLRGVKGRPRGVKGHYKMVDSRSKKDTRAKIRQAKQKKGGRR